MNKHKVIRVSTVPISLNFLLKGQLKFLNQYFDITAVSGRGKDLEEVQQREKVTVEPISMERKISPLQDLISLFSLYLFFKKIKPIIVHSITPKAGLLSMLAAKMAGVPIRIHTFTGLIFPSKKGGMQKILIQMDRLLCWASTNIYPEGNGVKKDLIQFDITKKQLKVLANGNVNGIDIKYFNPKLFSELKKNELREQLEIKKEDFVFIFVGRLVRDKGINELVSAFKAINNPYAKLLLVGSEERKLDPLNQETIHEIELNPNIIAVGFQQDVRPYFAIADCLVFPSYREGFPNVVMQAGAMELPGIVTDVNGCNEIIEDGKNGVIISSKKIKPILESMQSVLVNKTLFDALKRNSRAMIVSRYEQSMVWNALLEEYKRLLDV